MATAVTTLDENLATLLESHIKRLVRGATSQRWCSRGHRSLAGCRPDGSCGLQKEVQAANPALRGRAPVPVPSLQTAPPTCVCPAWYAFWGCTRHHAHAETLNPAILAVASLVAPREHDHNRITQLDPLEVARQLCLVHTAAAVKIQPVQLLAYAATVQSVDLATAAASVDADAVDTTVALSDTVRRADSRSVTVTMANVRFPPAALPRRLRQLRNLVAATVLAATDLRRRQEVLRFWVLVAEVSPGGDREEHHRPCAYAPPVPFTAD